ncbi:adenylate cyclase [Rhodospirillales bacterium TMPK1]|uniref:Adenylate cyclase n=2 Tax=Roseiterribacter gracilis TaxID=2812848 RepID=A0A8S8XGH8_9PROT|nr:adenylate cyclase [Rhodospirillales bacterium TMPK1]
MTGLHVQMLGPLTIRRDGNVLTLPASRKARALFAYLALAPHAVTRSQLCELLWDVPNDPRGELRWCLSKIRGLIETADQRRVETAGDTVRLDLRGCFVDAIAIAEAVQNLATVAPARLRQIASFFGGDFLDGLEIDRSPVFNGWLIAQRRRFRFFHAAVLERLVSDAGDDEILGHLEAWLELAPFDHRVHDKLLQTLARRGRIREGEEHLAATAKSFEVEGLDSAPLYESWRNARGQPAMAVVPDASEVAATPATRRASIAVMPFVDGSFAGDLRGGAADAMAHDIITRLAKLRSLFVIAQGSVFALHERKICAEDAGRVLNVDYVVSGSVRRQGNQLTVIVELAETRTARIVWAERFDQKLDDAFLVLDEIGNRIVASIASEVETNERNLAILKPPNSLTAWEAHHRGLWHMYRFNKADNQRAQHFFEMAVRLDPTFARAYAGLSFTHFQSAFQGWADRKAEIDLAYDTAGRSMLIDDRDPAAHWAVGRALWLRGQYDDSVDKLKQAIDLSPNFALGHYALAFVQSQAGDPTAAILSSDHSRHLSPFDPLIFAMLGARALALVRLGQFEEAADWAAKAAARPNAHAQIHAIAACSLALAGRTDEARLQLATIHKTQPRYSSDDFFTALKFDADGERLFREGARRVGMR